MLRRRTLAITVAVAVLAGYAGGCRSREKTTPAAVAEKPAVTVETAAATTADLVEGVRVTGSLWPRFNAEVKSELTGRVAELLVTEWEPVRKGDPLARIDTTEMEIVLAKARAAVEASGAVVQTAQASRETARANAETARAAVESARAALVEANVGLERAQREYDRVRNLKDAGLATAQALDEALTMRDAARARQGTVLAQISAAQAQAQAAEAQVATAGAQVAAAQAQLAVSREDVRQMESRVARAVVRAPFDGTVAERLVNVGEVVGEMQKVIFRVVDSSRLDLTASVPSREMARISVGQTVTFLVDALPGREFAGRIRFINPTVDPADRSVRITVEVANPDGVLKGGLFAKALIATGVRRGVLRVPRSALFNWDAAAGTADLFVVEGGKAARLGVGVGNVEGDLAEITRGLAPGQRVVVRGGFNLRDGDRVTVAGGEGT
jgi:RND family efflux transporter MFP subunit